MVKENEKGDFTANIRLLWITGLAVAIGAGCSVVAWGLLDLIRFFTQIFFYHRFSFEFASPADNHLGWWVVGVPVIGGLIIGFMARYGSDRIRGHGIPEALEAILFGKSKMSLKVAILKPISAAISIGSGGPFGAEGPIIMTGGAFGSLLAQIFHLTAAERKTLLVAGACAGMAAVFASPVAAAFLAVELLLFELKPRSAVPVMAACAVAAILRPYLLPPGPLFPMAAHEPLAMQGLLLALVVGIVAGIFASLLTLLVYFFEDHFQKLPFHWMWYPALGGVVVGLGGYFQPRAMGVGYDVIADFLKGGIEPTAALGLILVKAFIWAVALGSGTSGGVLAPLLIFGGGLGVVEASIFHLPDPGLWALVGMAAVLGGVMRVPFTAVVFAFELTRDTNALLPLFISATAAYAFTVLVMKRSILTEKVARRGFHVLREYSVDLLEKNHVEDVMTKNPRSIPASLAIQKLDKEYFHGPHKHQGYPVVDEHGALVGVITRHDLKKPKKKGRTVGDYMTAPAVVAHPHETCRMAATRMARHQVGRLPVVSDNDHRHLLGILTRSDLIKPNVAHFEEEEIRERMVKLDWKLPGVAGGHRKAP